MTNSLKAACAACLLLSTAAHAQTSPDANLPLWEFGLGAAALSTPSYPGADERDSMPRPAQHHTKTGENRCQV